MSRDPFVAFALDIETPLMCCRGRLCAVQTILTQPGADDGLDFDDLDAVRTLVMECWRDIKAAEADLEAVFAAARKQQAPTSCASDELGRLHVEGGAPRLDAGLPRSVGPRERGQPRAREPARPVSAGAEPTPAPGARVTRTEASA